ncbi:MAG: pilus assembly protein PilM [Planctomycetaceae bacterium]|nr:pilus assembly protein PilM [Planctomycetaceae bacterium]
MAKNVGVWGIDIGQCALKAMRCTLDGDQVVADAFDYVEYPKILTQPEANPEELIQEALQQFLSRNDLTGDMIAMSLPGQSGLAKFFKPPPVDAKKIPDLVKYEARQQIPFDLEEVIWDYQQMGWQSDDSEAAIETEVGLFAIKRDQLLTSIKPFDDADIDLDIVQLSPLSVYNFVVYDLLNNGEDLDDYDPENPPESIVILSMGTETTDLVITNGQRVWQRSIPVGGNHFTRQLTKELKLTFAKAEHLKRNARQAKDAKVIFQSMRPVFNDLVTEVQRSIGYFQGIDRKTTIRSAIAMGNAVKLPGLRQYLSKNLGYEVEDFDSFSRLGGSSVTSNPAFRDNVLSFGVCFGLCLQGLGEARLQTNLVPREIMIERLIRAKKPWVVVSLAALLLACAVNFSSYYGIWNKVHKEHSQDNITWNAALSQVGTLKTESTDHKTKDDGLVSQLNQLKAIGTELASNGDRRLLWLELFRAINQALPRDKDFQPGVIRNPEDKPFNQRSDLYIEAIETQHFEDLTTWFDEDIKKRYLLSQPWLQQQAQAAAAAAAEDAGATGTEPPSNIEVTGPEGAGWVIEIRGYHYFNKDLRSSRAQHVRNTLIKNLAQQKVRLPRGNGDLETFTMAELGLGYALLLSDGTSTKEKIPNPNYTPPKPVDEATAPAAKKPAVAKDDDKKKPEPPPQVAFFEENKYSFTVQFCWQQKLLTQRITELDEKRAAEAEARKAAEEEKKRQEQAEADNNTVAANSNGKQ